MQPCLLNEEEKKTASSSHHRIPLPLNFELFSKSEKLFYEILQYVYERGRATIVTVPCHHDVFRHCAIFTILLHYPFYFQWYNTWCFLPFYIFFHLFFNRSLLRTLLVIFLLGGQVCFKPLCLA